MNTLELLDKYPKATACIKKWFMKKMIESFDDLTVPESFKLYMQQEGVSTDKIITMIEAQPRALFDVFDDNQIFIFIYPEIHPLNKFLSFTYKIMCSTSDCEYGVECSTRKEVEEVAIQDAFEILENKLT